MNNKLWPEMTTAEKIDWLHDALRRQIDIENQNANRLDNRHRDLTNRLASVEAEVKTAKEDLQALRENVQE